MIRRTPPELIGALVRDNGAAPGAVARGDIVDVVQGDLASDVGVIVSILNGAATHRWSEREGLGKATVDSNHVTA